MLSGFYMCLLSEKADRRMEGLKCWSRRSASYPAWQRLWETIRRTTWDQAKSVNMKKEPAVFSTDNHLNCCQILFILQSLKGQRSLCLWLRKRIHFKHKLEGNKLSEIYLWYLTQRQLKCKLSNQQPTAELFETALYVLVLLNRGMNFSIHSEG